MTACGCFYVRRPQTVNSQAVLERRKRGGLTTKLSSEQISCTRNRKKMGVFVENQIKTLIIFVADQRISRKTNVWPFVKL